MEASEAKRLKELEAENAKLNERVAEAELDQSDAQGRHLTKTVVPTARRRIVSYLQGTYAIS